MHIIIIKEFIGTKNPITNLFKSLTKGLINELTRGLSKDPIKGFIKGPKIKDSEVRILISKIPERVANLILNGTIKNDDPTNKRISTKGHSSYRNPEAPFSTIVIIIK